MASWTSGSNARPPFRCASRRALRASRETGAAPARRPAAAPRARSPAWPTRSRDRDCRRRRAGPRESRGGRVRCPSRSRAAAAAATPRTRSPPGDTSRCTPARLVLLGELPLELLDVGRLRRAARRRRRRRRPRAHQRRSTTFTGISCSLSVIDVSCEGPDARASSYSAGAGAAAGAGRASNANASLPSSRPIVTVPPCSSRPNRISSVSGSRTSVWMTRASGRAP